MTTINKPTAEQVKILADIAMKHAELGIEADYEPPIEAGPVLTSYKFRPKGRTKVQHLESLAKDYAMITQTESVVVKRMPGDSFVTLFVPNAERKVPKFLDVAGQTWKIYHDSQLTAKPIRVPLMLGMDWKGETFVADLADQPHLLVAGTTGGGKSNEMRALITSIVYSVNSSVVKLVISDTKNVEFPVFDRVPHLFYPRALSSFQTVEQWQLLCEISDSRLKDFANDGVTNIHEYNARREPNQRVAYIVVIVDELADVLELGKIAVSKLDYIVRKSRAAGIYVIAGTQRPSVKVVEGQIKANFPARLCFRTGSQVDSRVVLDTNGAEGLLEVGDMLFKPGAGAGLHRLHAPLAKLEDVKAILHSMMFMDFAPKLGS